MEWKILIIFIVLLYGFAILCHFAAKHKRKKDATAIDVNPEAPEKVIYRQKIIINDKNSEIKELKEELEKLKEKAKPPVYVPRPEYKWEMREGCHYLIYNGLLPKRIHPQIWGQPKERLKKGEAFSIPYKNGNFANSINGLTAPATGTLFILLYGKDRIEADDEIAMIDPDPAAVDKLARYMEEVRKREDIEEEEKERQQKAWESQKIEIEKKEIARKIKERERRRQLEKIVRQELIDSGQLFGDEPKRPPIPREVVDAVYRRDGGRCVYCGSTEDLQIDHIIPFSKGGSSELANLQLLCRKCNIEKSNKIG